MTKQQKGKTCKNCHTANANFMARITNKNDMVKSRRHANNNLHHLRDFYWIKFPYLKNLLCELRKYITHFHTLTI